MEWTVNSFLPKLTICCTLFMIKLCYASFEQKTGRDSVEMQTNISKCFQTSLDDGTLLVNCSSQDLERLPMLPNVHKLVVLDMSYNHIKKLEVLDDQDSFSRVIRLILSHNKIAELTDTSFAFTDGLTDLNVSFNVLTKIKGAFESLLQLKVLDLSHNKLATLPRKLFSNLNSLSYLYLSGNNLVTVPDVVPILTWFDLSFNKIQEVEEALSHVIYPHEVTLLGGNPFRCDCNLLWLKELYDTREYLLKFINVDKDKFIPVCEYPETLKGDTWDVIGDDVFECYKDAKNEGSDQIALLDDSVEKVVTESDEGIIDFKASDITPGSVRLEWLTNTALLVAIFYRKFGDISRKQAAVLPATVNSFVLRNLKANQPYIVCIALKEEVNIDKVEKENCIEIMTADDKSNNFEILNLFSHAWLSIPLVMLLTCTCVILAVVYCVYAQNSVSKKQKQS